MPPFRIGINMAGAVSAGAYTAGVLDFLIEALDAWHDAKLGRQSVPMHEVSIEVMSGASAGGMCAAIGAVSLYDRPSTAGANSKLFHTWVDEIDISDLLELQDLTADPVVRSVLDCTKLQQVADSVLQLSSPVRRPFVSRQLALFLTLTNLRGIPYSVDFAQGGSFEEHINYYADQIQFEVLEPATAPRSNLSYALRTNDLASHEWTQLKRAALATGAFPVMLAPRILPRQKREYDDRMWTIATDNKAEGYQNQTTVPPAWGSPGPEATFDTVNVDGGATDNNPFECARRFLAGLDGKLHNDRNGFRATAAVLTVAPFPGNDQFNRSYDATQASALGSTLPALFGALINQSRFQGESLSLLSDPSVFSRFVIAPRDENYPEMPALQCAALDAFGGFLARGFRNRDYHLGRRNCQRFLRDYFVLPVENPVISHGLGADKVGLSAAFKAADPNVPRPAGINTDAWMPIIPLCAGLDQEVPYPKRVQITQGDVEKIVDSAIARLSAVAKRFYDGQGVLATIVGWEAQLFLKFKVKSWLRSKITDALRSTHGL
jgi:predicted acylesterase/phospholipase RssA